MQLLTFVGGGLAGSFVTSVVMLAAESPGTPGLDAAVQSSHGTDLIRLKMRADAADSRASAAASHSLRVQADLADLWVLSARLALRNADLEHELHRRTGPFAEVTPADLIPAPKPGQEFPVAPAPEGP